MICCSLVHPFSLVAFARVLLCWHWLLTPSARSVVYLGGHFRTQTLKTAFLQDRVESCGSGWRKLYCFDFFQLFDVIALVLLVLVNAFLSLVCWYSFRFWVTIFKFLVEFAPQWFCASASDDPFLLPICAPMTLRVCQWIQTLFVPFLFSMLRRVPNDESRPSYCLRLNVTKQFFRSFPCSSFFQFHSKWLQCT